MDNLIIEDTLQKENIPFYQYSEFEDAKSISGNVYKATFKTSQKCISLNDKFSLDNLKNENSENILIHNGSVKFNVFGLTKIIPESLKFLTNTLGPFQYIDSQYLEIFSTIGKIRVQIFSVWKLFYGKFPVATLLSKWNLSQMSIC
ncbi:hypothetical protein Glove_117g330 [Diversispora epigaea]|uniref:Uncharacterized protein n=1 Tax=Diversispora epigaea TaxID=1348612 RepID=A0A397J6L9_9GLOM|nr:hypothetical protein Glove_117g330 [Diversispora epigaea]